MSRLSASTFASKLWTEFEITRSRPAPATPEGEVVSWADRIAYVCHDFEDAVAADIVAPDQLPSEIRDSCGTTRSSQLRAFISAMIDATTTSGRVGMTPGTADALARFRKVNYENSYMRDASRAQAKAVIDLLRSLVEHYIKFPHLIGDSTRTTEDRFKVRRP